MKELKKYSDNNSLQQENRTDFSLMSNIAHDLKAPLQQIYVLSKMMSEGNINLSNDEKQDFLNHITNASNKLSTYIDEIINHSKSLHINKQKREKISLKSLVEEIKFLLPNVKYKISSFFMTDEIISDKIILKQVLLNLFTNAIKYNNKEVPAIEVYMYSNKNSYEIHVADNGIGIEPKNHDSLFKPFQILTCKDRFGNAGNGLGLATVKELVSKIGGRINVTSELDKGAVFSLSIPKTNN